MDWDKVDKEALETMFYRDNLTDSQIGEMYGVSKNKVRYKRHKYGITIERRIVITAKRDDKEMFDQINNEAKSKLCDRANIDSVSKALTQYIFRCGPVENMHGEGKLTQSDMKALNKFMVNRIAGILEIIADDEWFKLELLYNLYNNSFSEWDKAEPDTSDIDFILKRMLGKQIPIYNLGKRLYSDLQE